MVGRRGLRGGRLNPNQVDSFANGRGQGVGCSEFFEGFEPEFGLGFVGRVKGGASRDSVGRIPKSEEQTGRGGAAFSRGGRSRTPAAARGRIGGVGISVVVGGGAFECGLGDAQVGGSRSGTGASRGFPNSQTTRLGGSESASEQDGSWSDRTGRGGRSRGRTNSSRGRSSQENSEIDATLHAERREKGQKGKNFTAEEERQLTRSVLRISQDPIIGNGQKGSAFWERIFQHYNERKPSHFRPARSLESKWGLIKHDVAKFIGVLQQCSNLNVSGANASDVLQNALELYWIKTPKHTDFAYLHVWELVKDVPRWNVGSTQEKPSAPTMKKKELSTSSQCTFLERDSSTDADRASPAPASRLRPQGSKQAKEERWIKVLRESAALAQADATKAMAKATMKKTEIMKDANLFMLMTHPTDGVISECATRYLKLRQEEELEKLETCLAEARAEKARVRVTPASIPVESANVLRSRVAAAMTPPIRRQQLRNSSIRHDDDGARENEQATVVSPPMGCHEQGGGNSGMLRRHDTGNTEWNHEEEDDDEEVGSDNQYDNHHNYTEVGVGNDSQHADEGHEGQEDDDDDQRNKSLCAGDEEDQGGSFKNYCALEDQEGAGNGRQIFESPMKSGTGSYNSHAHGFHQPMMSNTLQLRGNHFSPFVHQNQQNFMPPHRALVQSPSTSKSQWSLPRQDNPAINLDEYEATEIGSSNANKSLDLNATFF